MFPELKPDLNIRVAKMAWESDSVRLKAGRIDWVTRLVNLYSIEFSAYSATVLKLWKLYTSSGEPNCQKEMIRFTRDVVLYGLYQFKD
jgi:hypothetical protein